MKKIALILFLNLFSFIGHSQEKNFIDQPYIETISSVDTLVIPDKIFLSILISEKDTRGKITVEELEDKMNTKLTQLGINTNKQLSLLDVTSNFKNYFLKNRDILKNKTYSLLLNNTETAGKVIVALEAIGIANVYLTKTEYSLLEKLKSELKQKAILKAKIQAEIMLKPLNQKLGNVLYISNYNIKPNNIRNNYGFQTVSGIKIRGAGTVSSNKKYKPVSIEFEKIKVGSTVAVKFKIE